MTKQSIAQNLVPAPTSHVLPQLVYLDALSEPRLDAANEAAWCLAQDADRAMDSAPGLIVANRVGEAVKLRGFRSRLTLVLTFLMINRLGTMRQNRVCRR